MTTTTTGNESIVTCPRCGRTGRLRHRVDGTFRCEACGFDSRKEPRS